MPGFDWPGYTYLGKGGWRNDSGGQWSFNCVDCWFHMEAMTDIGCRAHAYTHVIKRKHTVIITDNEGNKTMEKAVILTETDQPPF